MNQKFTLNLFILLLCAVFVVKAQYQNAKLEIFTQNHGLSNSHIICMVQDPKGFIWIGTDNGLNKFDGFNFVGYSNVPKDKYSLPDDGITALHIDKNGILWVGTVYGLVKFDSQTERFHPYPFYNSDSSTFFSPVRAIAEDESGNLWLGTSGAGLQIFNLKTESFLRRPPTLENLSKQLRYIFTLAFDNDKNLWVGLEREGLYCIDATGNGYKYYNTSNSRLKNNAILSLFPDRENVWIGARGGGLSVYNSSKDAIQSIDDLPTIPDNLKSADVYSIDKDNKGIIWLGTNNGGLLLFDPVKSLFFRHPAYDSGERLKSKSLKVIFRDKDENVWFGIHQLGISLFRNFESPFIDDIYSPTGNKSLGNNSVLGLLVDSEGNLWIGTDGSGLIMMDKDTKEYKQYKHEPGNQNSLPNNVVRAIYEDKNKSIWIGTYKGGLSRLDKTSGKFINYFYGKSIQQRLDFDDVVSFAEDRIGNLWIATNGGGLYRYQYNPESFVNYYPRDKKNKTSICSEWIVTLFPDSKGNLWIGTYWGLSKFNPVNEEFTNYTHDDNDSGSISHNHVFAVNEDSNGNIWIGTKYGLNFFNPVTRTFKAFTIKDGLPSNVINAILTDDKNNLWISTNNGICCFNAVTRNIKNFYFTDGLQNNEFIRNSFFKCKDGKLFFGGVNGFNSFYPDKIKIDVIFPHVLITDFQIFNKSVAIGQLNDGRKILEKSINETTEIYLDYSDNSFSFEFIALDYIKPESILYACKMDGFEENWNVQSFKRRFITYTNLNPGTYIFRVKASNRKDIWGDKATEVIIHIRPPLWKTGWAYLFYLIFLLGAVLLAGRIVQDRIKVIRQIRFEKHKNEHMEQVNQAKLEFFTNISHEFRTPLTLIIGPIENLLESRNMTSQVKNTLKLMHRNAHRLLRLVNQLLDLRKIEKGKLKLQAHESDLNVFIQDVVQSFEELAIRKKIKFIFENQLPGLKIWFDADKMDKILFNLLSNAFKFTPENGRIEISLTISDRKESGFKNGAVVVSVADNGRGMSEEQVKRVFERFYQSSDSESSIQKGSGIGLSLTRSLVELHHGEITIKSKKGEGSTFAIKLPVGKEHLSVDELLPEEFFHSENPNLQPVVLDGFDDDFTIDTSELANESAPLVLLVEDNDDVRNYIRSGLQNSYRIAEARNGLEGIEKTFELMPDLVICDVMMPEMDGIQFSKRIKTEMLTCHIPLILLTAKTSIEHRIEGLETGADSFIPKPFNSRHLLVRIQKLIELRQVLKDKFKSNGHFEPVEMAITSTDQKFINKAVEIIKKEISNTEFNVENLGQEIGMSRGHLHRKFKALIGQNPSDFIRTIRLKQAAHLLNQEKIPVSEISYLVGFSSPSYFASCFHKQFGLTPTEYKNSKS